MVQNYVEARVTGQEMWKQLYPISQPLSIPFPTPPEHHVLQYSEAKCSILPFQQPQKKTCSTIHWTSQVTTTPEQ